MAVRNNDVKKVKKKERKTMTTRKIRGNHANISVTLLLACTVLSLLLSACGPALAATQLPTVPPVQNAQPTATSLPVQPATEAPVSTATSAPTAAPSVAEISLDLAGTASDLSIETIAAVTDNGGAYWEILPEHRVATLQGYPQSVNALQPQIFVFPLADLSSFNETAGKAAAELQGLLQSRQPGEKLPFLPLYNEMQVMHAQVQFLDFKNGQGVRFLTQYDQAPYKVNNAELFYTFQGLTSDGKYYVAAVLPVSHPDLPASQVIFSENADEMSKFQPYLVGVVSWLDVQPGSGFTPDLAKLDAMMQSMEVK